MLEGRFEAAGLNTLLKVSQQADTNLGAGLPVSDSC